MIRYEGEGSAKQIRTVMLNGPSYRKKFSFHVKYLVSALHKFLEAKANVKSLPIRSCERTAPIAKALASVVNKKGYSKLGYMRIRSDINTFFKLSKDS